MIPTTYAEWRTCIERDCGIPLTPEFIAAPSTMNATSLMLACG